MGEVGEDSEQSGVAVPKPQIPPGRAPVPGPRESAGHRTNLADAGAKVVDAAQYHQLQILIFLTPHGSGLGARVVRVRKVKDSERSDFVADATPSRRAILCCLTV